MTKIKLHNIMKIKRHRFFSSDICTKYDLNKIIQTKIKITMLGAMLNNSTEVLLIMNNTTFKHKLNTNKNIESVNIPKDIIQILNNENDNTTYTMVHNHPNNNNFSIKDLITFIFWNKINVMFICTNDCKYIAALYKSYKVNSELRTKMLITIKKYMEKHNVGEHASAIQLIEFFESKGILYMCERNY